MDTNQRQERDIVYCHQCENEWFRDEHGLTCPQCQSDFTEIVEADNDPRDDEQHIPADTPPGLGGLHAPDPDEQDIENLRNSGMQWENTGPGTYRLRGTYRTDLPMGPGQQGQQGQGMGGGLMGLIGNVLQGMAGPQQQQQRQQGSPQPQGPTSPGRPASAPGSRSPDEQQQRGGGGTFVRHGHGPGFSYTIASSSGGGGNLFPRNANGPQPFQNQPDHIEQMLAQMFSNIGAVPGGPGGPGGPMGGGMRMGPGGPGGHPFHDDDGFMGGPMGGGPFIIGGAHGRTGGPHGIPAPLANLLSMFGPPGGVMGDAVFSQEDLDRVITQLMEQHQTGNAPGPASEAAIKALPTKEISKEDQGENGRAECSICMDVVEIGGTVTVLPCHHWFHHECIKAWLSEHDTCPHCRQGIMPKDDSNSTGPRDPHQEPLNDMRSPEYTRPAPPGAYPFPRMDSTGSGGGEGSPNMNRRNSTGSNRRRSNGGSGGMFSRMRDAFGGGGGGSRG